MIPLLRKGCCVAIWIGHFTDELDADEYLYADFQEDFRCTVEENNVPELAVTEVPKPLRDLLTGFSSSKEFLDAAVHKAESLGIQSASTAVVYYTTQYDDTQRSSPSAKLVFLGNFSW
jgi:hypothetical protein